MLRPIKAIFKLADYPDLLIGLDNPDDAAVWRLSQEQALVMTTDFFTPVVDDPYDYGAIAAANALSDVYAMGGQPFLALNIAAVPPDLPAEVLQEIVRGGAEKARQAGVVIAGGHSIQDKEPKYGLVVLGFVNPHRVMTKRGARVEDILVISKPLGFGVTTTALKQDKASAQDVAEVVDWMKHLNRQAANLALEHGIVGATDITGFGLLGHAWEMAEASGVGMRFVWDKLPFTAGALHYATEFTFPGGAYDNRSFYTPHVRFEKELSEEQKLLLFDPQTSGGLMLAVPAQGLEQLIIRFESLNESLWVIGEVTDSGMIVVN